MLGENKNNELDDKPYYEILPNKDETIKPVIYVTMSEIRERFGENVIILPDDNSN